MHAASLTPLAGSCSQKASLAAPFVPPPFVPRLRSPLDASHFDPPDDEDAAAAAVVEARERIGAAANWRAPAEAEADEPGCGIT